MQELSSTPPPNYFPLDFNTLTSCTLIVPLTFPSRHTPGSPPLFLQFWPLHPVLLSSHNGPVAHLALVGLLHPKASNALLAHLLTSLSSPVKALEMPVTSPLFPTFNWQPNPADSTP